MRDKIDLKLELQVFPLRSLATLAHVLKWDMKYVSVQQTIRFSTYKI